MISKRIALVAFAAIAASAPAHAAVTISTAATQNMSCSDGTCVPTAADAVLNASDLENDLSQFGNVRVMTTGNGVEANNIDVKAAFSSPDSTSLTLDAHKAIMVDAAVSIGSGTAELELQSNTLDATHALSFGRKGHIVFGSLSDIFGINGGIFTLVGSVQGLASAVAANPSGAYALASNYDASQDGTYTTVPIPTAFTGVFEGLGNEITNLTINDPTDDSVGLFAELDGGSTMRDLDVLRASVSGTGTFVGVVAGSNNGTLTNVGSSGSASNNSNEVGGIIGGNSGTIVTSRAATAVSGGSCAGGLVGLSMGGISESYSTGIVSGSSEVGGLACTNEDGTITNSYSTGAAVAASSGTVGGFEGANGGSQGTTIDSYSTGKVKGGVKDRTRGGFTGYDRERGALSDCYWDTDTSKFRNLHRGAGNFKSDTGITGLTTKQFQSGLPTGFDPSVWAEDSSINNGLPYLIANPPPK